MVEIQCDGEDEAADIRKDAGEDTVVSITQQQQEQQQPRAVQAYRNVGYLHNCCFFSQLLLDDANRHDKAPVRKKTTCVWN